MDVDKMELVMKNSEIYVTNMHIWVKSKISKIVDD